MCKAVILLLFLATSAFGQKLIVPCKIGSDCGASSGADYSLGLTMVFDGRLQWVPGVSTAAPADTSLVRNDIGVLSVKGRSTGLGSMRLGGLAVVPLATPAIATVVPMGTTGSSAYGYRVVALYADGTHSLPSAEMTTETGNSNLTTSNKIRVTWGSVSGTDVYHVYRSTGGGPVAIIGVTSGLTYDDVGSNVIVTDFPTTSTTGIVTAGTITAGTILVEDGDPAIGMAGAPASGIRFYSPGPYIYYNATGHAFGNANGSGLYAFLDSGTFGFNLSTAHQVTWGIVANSAVAGIGYEAPGVVKITDGGSNLGDVHAALFTGPVTALKSATTSVDVSASPAPSTGQVLKATDSTHATWQTLSAGLTNGAGANVIPKSDGTNLVASQISDDATTVTVATASAFHPAVSTDGTRSFLNVTGTLPASPSANVAGITETITSAGSAARTQTGLVISMNAGYTGPSTTQGVFVVNSNAGTGGGLYPLLEAFNSGITAYANGDSTGNDVGITAAGSNTLGNGIGVYGYGYGKPTGTGKGIGVIGIGDGGTSTIGGYFTLGSTGLVLPTNTVAALVVDNKTYAAPIALFRDNGTPVVTIEDGGAVTATQPISSPTFTKTGTNGSSLSRTSSTEAVTLNTGGTSTVSSTNLIPANSRIDAITYRITTTITTATAFDVKVTGGNPFASIGTATTAQSGLTATTTGILVPVLHADQYNTAATTLTVTTTGTPGAGVIEFVVFYEQFIAPSS